MKNHKQNSENQLKKFYLFKSEEEAINWSCAAKSDPLCSKQVEQPPVLKIQYLNNTKMLKLDHCYKFIDHCDGTIPEKIKFNFYKVKAHFVMPLAGQLTLYIDKKFITENKFHFSDVSFLKNKDKFVEKKEVNKINNSFK